MSRNASMPDLIRDYQSNLDTAIKLAEEEPNQNRQNLRMSFVSLAAGLTDVVHYLTTGACNFLANTWLKEITEPSRLPQGAFLLAHKKPNQNLFGTVKYLAGYPLVNSKECCLIAQEQDGKLTAWAWSFGGEEPAPPVTDTEGNPADQTKLDLVFKAVHFVTMLGELLDCQNCPLTVEEEEPAQNPPESAQAPIKSPRPVKRWISKSIRLDQPKVAHVCAKSADPEPLDRTGLTARQVRVVGHSRWQPCGPGGKDRKKIYVAEHDSIAWTSLLPHRINISVTAEE